MFDRHRTPTTSPVHVEKKKQFFHVKRPINDSSGVQFDPAKFPSLEDVKHEYDDEAQQEARPLIKKHHEQQKYCVRHSNASRYAQFSLTFFKNTYTCFFLDILFSSLLQSRLRNELSQFLDFQFGFFSFTNATVDLFFLCILRNLYLLISYFLLRNHGSKRDQNDLSPFESLEDTKLFKLIYNLEQTEHALEEPDIDFQAGDFGYILDKFNILNFVILYSVIFYVCSKCLLLLTFGSDSRYTIPPVWFFLFCCFSAGISYVHRMVFRSLHQWWEVCIFEEIKGLGNIRKYEIEHPMREMNEEKLHNNSKRNQRIVSIESKHHSSKKTSYYDLLRNVVAFSAPDLLYIIFGCMSLVISAVSTSSIPHFIGVAVSTAAKNPSDFYNSLWMLLVCTAISSLFAAARGGLFRYTLSSLSVRMRSSLFKSLLQQEIAFFDRSKPGNLVNRLNNDTAKLSDYIAVNVNIFLREIVSSAVILVFMFSISWKLALIAFIAIPCFTAISAFFGEKSRKIEIRTNSQLSNSNSIAQEAISNIQTVKSFGSESFEFDLYDQSLRESIYTAIQGCIYYALYMFGAVLCPNLILALVLLYGGKLVSQDEISRGEFVAFLLYVANLFLSIESISWVVSEFSGSTSASKKIFTLIKRVPKNLQRAEFIPIQFKGNITFREVFFSYPSRPNVSVLKNFSLEIKPLEVVALVGTSGGGKSSIIKLIQRFYSPKSGTIYIDGMDICNYENDWFRRMVAFVPREPVLFARSIKENICYGIPVDQTPLMEEVVMAAMEANAHDFISSLPLGYDTECGERGVLLSSGQKQRIAIARALIRKPSILLLDCDTTSLMDAVNESEVRRVMASIVKERKRTVVLITQRLSTIRLADRIVVISHGTIAEQGTHDELLMTGGAYANLIKRQIQIHTQNK